MGAAAEGMGMYPPPGAADPPLLVGRRHPKRIQHTSEDFTSIERKE
jgi:hypothetical protein